ncbi:Protein of unknown function, partial [Gryllus bimaculatus]
MEVQVIHSLGSGDDGGKEDYSVVEVWGGDDNGRSVIKGEMKLTGRITGIKVVGYSLEITRMVTAMLKVVKSVITMTVVVVVVPRPTRLVDIQLSSGVATAPAMAVM